MIDLLNSYPPVLNIGDVAEILEVSSNTIRKLIHDGSLHAVKIGKRYKITKTKLLLYLGEPDEKYNSETR